MEYPKITYKRKRYDGAWHIYEDDVFISSIFVSSDTVVPVSEIPEVPEDFEEQC